jgi:hypothetical protein
MNIKDRKLNYSRDNRMLVGDKHGNSLAEFQRDLDVLEEGESFDD